MLKFSLDLMVASTSYELALKAQQLRALTIRTRHLKLENTYYRYFLKNANAYVQIHDVLAV